MRFSAILKASKQKGYSLVELSVALAIVAVILVGGLMGARQLLLTNSVNNQVKDMATVIAKVQRHYARQPNTAGATTQTLAPLSVWPSERAVVNGSIWAVRGVLNGSSEAIFANDTALGTLPAGGGFIYTIKQVPVDACADLVSALDTVAFAIYAGAASATAASGAIPAALTTVKTADTSAVNMASLATGCTTGNVSSADIAVVFRQ